MISLMVWLKLGRSLWIVQKHVALPGLQIYFHECVSNDFISVQLNNVSGVMFSYNERTVHPFGISGLR